MKSPSRKELLEAVKSADPARKEMAISEIGNLGDPALLPYLLDILDDPSEKIRWRALQSIGKMEASSPDDRVLGLLKDPSPRVRSEAARVVGLAGTRQHAPALSPLLDDQDLQVRCRAIEALGDIGESEVDLLARIITFLQDSDSSIRMHAALTLGKCRHPPAFAPLIDSLQDPNHNVRGLSAWSLGNLGDERAIEALIDALEDEGEAVRIYAYQALDAFGPKALPALENAQTRKDGSSLALLGRLFEDIAVGAGEED